MLYFGVTCAYKALFDIFQAIGGVMDAWLKWI